MYARMCMSKCVCVLAEEWEDIKMNSATHMQCFARPDFN